MTGLGEGEQESWGMERGETEQLGLAEVVVEKELTRAMEEVVALNARNVKLVNETEELRRDMQRKGMKGVGRRRKNGSLTGREYSPPTCLHSGKARAVI